MALQSIERSPNYVFKPTAEEVARFIHSLPRGVGLTGVRRHNRVILEPEPEPNLLVGVRGESHNNDDGASRQDIIRRMRANDRFNSEPTRQISTTDGQSKSLRNLESK